MMCLCAVTFYVLLSNGLAQWRKASHEPEAQMTSLTLINPIDTNTFTHLIFDWGWHNTSPTYLLALKKRCLKSEIAFHTILSPTLNFTLDLGFFVIQLLLFFAINVC